MTEQDAMFQTEDDLKLEEEVLQVQTEKYLLFLSDGLLFGVPAEEVVEIITNHTVTWLPLVPDYVRGIINLRGQIIPIVDIRRLLNHPGQDSNCIIILRTDSGQVGILVDQVQKMVDVEESSILPAPPQSSRELVCGMCSLEDGQTMLAFDCERLMELA